MLDIRYWNALLTVPFSKEAVDEYSAAFKIQEDVITEVHSIGSFHDIGKRGSERGFESYKLESYFRLCKSRAMLNKVLGTNYVIHIDEVSSGGRHGEARNCKHGCYRALLDTWVGYISAAMHPGKSYVGKLLVSKKGG